MAEVTLAPAYVLHARPYRESSLLVEALSREHGRLGLVARGARGSRSRWRNLLQPFRPLLLSWRQRGELATLTHAEQVASMHPAQGEAVLCGMYLNELLMRLLHRSDPHPALFDAYREFLSGLAHHGQPQPLLRAFEKRLLDELGFGLQLHAEADSGLPVSASCWYRYLPDRGPVRAEPRGVSSGEDADRELISGAALLAYNAGRIEPEHLRELKWLMRRVLHYHLGDKPLKTQSLFS